MLLYSFEKVEVQSGIEGIKEVSSPASHYKRLFITVIWMVYYIIFRFIFSFTECGSPHVFVPLGNNQIFCKISFQTETIIQ